MSEPTNQEAITKLLVNQAIQDERLKTLEQVQSSNNSALKDIQKILSEIRGGRKALMLVVSAAAAVGAGIAWATKHIILQ